MSDRAQLQELHDAFVWEVNAAVGEGRPDLVRRLADDYLDQALRLITEGEQPWCGSPGCEACSASASVTSPSRRSRWSRRSRGDRAA